ncbi:MAG: endonuclease/exonuclease/phosphatase family protein [Myxococcales bacterium]
MPLRVLRAAVIGLIGLTIAALGLHGLGGLGVFPPGSTLSGVTYLSASWWTPVVLPLAVGGWALRRRGLAAALIGAFAVVIGVAGDYSLRRRPPSPAGVEQKLSVVAWNVRGYRDGRAEVLRALKAIGADVALLSENVLTPEEREQVRKEVLPAEFHMGRSGETAIISGYPILDFKEVDFPDRQVSLFGPNSLEAGDKAPFRSFVHAVVDVRGLPVNVISVRMIAGRPPANGPWQQIRWGLYLLRAQADEFAFFENYLRRLKGPFVFGGDLNATPPSFGVRRLSAVAPDSYLALHSIGRPTFRVSAPLSRLDYLFASRELTPVRSARLDVMGSDHFPVYAEYRLSPERMQESPSRTSAALPRP